MNPVNPASHSKPLNGHLILPSPLHQTGNVMVKKVSNVLLCMHANKSVPLGVLKTKVDTLANFLESPLNCVLPC